MDNETLQYIDELLFSADQNLTSFLTFIQMLPQFNLEVTKGLVIGIGKLQHARQVIAEVQKENE